MNKFSDILHQARVNKGITMRELAEIIGCENKDVSDYENGHAIPNGSEMIEIAEYFDIKIDDLWESTKYQEKENKRINASLTEALEISKEFKCVVEKHFCNVPDEIGKDIVKILLLKYNLEFKNDN